MRKCKSCSSKKLHFGDKITAAGFGKDEIDFLLRDVLDKFGLEFRWSQKNASVWVVLDTPRNSNLVMKARSKGILVLTPIELLRACKNVCYKRVGKLNRPPFKNQIGPGKIVFIYAYHCPRRIVDIIEQSGATVKTFRDKRGRGFRPFHWHGAIWTKKTLPLGTTCVIDNDWHREGFPSFTSRRTYENSKVPVYSIGEVTRALKGVRVKPKKRRRKPGRNI